MSDAIDVVCVHGCFRLYLIKQIVIHIFHSRNPGKFQEPQQKSCLFSILYPANHRNFLKFLHFLFSSLQKFLHFQYAGFLQKNNAGKIRRLVKWYIFIFIFIIFQSSLQRPHHQPGIIQCRT